MNVSHTQHDFRPKLCTDTSLHVITNKVYDKMDKNVFPFFHFVIYLVFDSVHHLILLRKLSLVNVGPVWFEGYINDRTQPVHFGSTISSQQNVPNGVPQALILSPILFSIHVKDRASYENINNCLLV